MIRDKRLRLLAYTSEGAPPGSPEAPTLRAAGVDLDMVQWHGLFAPKGLPKNLLSQTNAATNAAVESPDVTRAYLAAGATPAPTTPDAFAKLLRSEILRWREVVRAANIRAE
jgi:tripartite-type tricarboxylate transporter receptor subunit TctC